jgi:signal transduction histidine kinase
MFLILLLVSRRAVEPLAKNIERQQRFVTDAGHELKTPLAIILANTDALELHHGAGKWSANIRAQVQRLDGLMHHLLTLSRMDEGENTFPMAQVDVSRLVEEVLSSFGESAKQKGLQISTEIAPELIINASAESLALLVSVLADNAVKYADEGGTVAVKLAASGKKTVLEITNSCQTLPDAPPERLFERFFRGDAARTQKDGGYGIGLSVAQAVAAMHRGKIEAFYDDEHTVRFKVEL